VELRRIEREGDRAALRDIRHAGQTAALCRMTVRQCGQVRVAPAGVRRTVVTRPGWSPA
jgi:hypothetical protein